MELQRARRVLPLRQPGEKVDCTADLSERPGYPSTTNDEALVTWVADTNQYKVNATAPFNFQALTTGLPRSSPCEPFAYWDEPPSSDAAFYQTFQQDDSVAPGRPPTTFARPLVAWDDPAQDATDTVSSTLTIALKLSTPQLHILLNGEDAPGSVPIVPGQAYSLEAKFFRPGEEITPADGESPAGNVAKWTGPSVSLSDATDSDGYKVGRACRDGACIIEGFQAGMTSGAISVLKPAILDHASTGTVYFPNNSGPQQINVTATLPEGGKPVTASFTATFPETSFSATTCHLGVVSKAGFFASGAFVPPIPGLTGSPTKVGKGEKAATYPPPAYGLGWSSDCDQNIYGNRFGTRVVTTKVDPVGIFFSGSSGKLPQGSLALGLLWDDEHGSTKPGPLGNYGLDNGFPWYVAASSNWTGGDSPGGYLNPHWVGDFYLSVKYSAYLMYRPPSSDYRQSIWVALDRMDYRFTGTLSCEPLPVLGAPELHGPLHWAVTKPSSLPRQLNGKSFSGAPEWTSFKPNTGARAPDPDSGTCS